MPVGPSSPSKTTDPLRDIGHYFKVFQTHLGLRIYLIFALTLLAALMEGVGILMLLPLLHGLDRAADPEVASAENGVTELMQSILSIIGLEDSVLAILLAITFAFLLKGVLVFLATGYDAYLRGQLLRELKERLFRSYIRMTYNYYVSQNTGHFINIINSQIATMLLAFKSLTRVGAQTLNSVIYLILAFAVAWRFGLMAFLLGISLFMMFRWINIYARNLSRKTSAENGVLEKLLIQTLQGYKYLASTGQSELISRNVSASIRRLTGFKIRSGIAGAFTGAVREPILVVLIMIIVISQLVIFEQELAPILVSILLFQRGLASILNIQVDWQQLLNSVGGIEMVRDEFERQGRFREPRGGVNIGTLSTSITLKNIDFAYGPNEDAILQDLSLMIPVRTSVALVGESGAGKSTVLDLITLMLKPNRGKVLIDGVPGDKINQLSWRKQIGYVSQEAVIFDDTIANNICLWAGNPNKDSSLMDRIMVAAQQAHLAEFIEKLPDKYGTVVGDRGTRLSGGQRQRLFIARELFRQPSVLLLDEATSALDSEAELAIRQSFEALKGQITLVIVAHRLSTIRNVDQIYVLENGKLVEQGSYKELCDLEHSRFGRMVANQAR